MLLGPLQSGLCSLYKPELKPTFPEKRVIH